MKVLLLPKYGRRGASSRLRFFQYAPYLENQGFVCHIAPLFDDTYVERRSRRKGGAAKAAGIGALLRALSQRWRVIQSASEYDLVFMHCELFPYLPPVLETRLFQQQAPVVADYDDAIFHNYDQHRNPVIRRTLGTKIASVLSQVRGVIGGCPYLVEYARNVNKNVWLLPTVVDLSRYQVRGVLRKAGDRFTAGWIGSFSTMPYLHEIQAPLATFSEEVKGRLLIVGAGKSSLPVPQVEYRQWSEETEVADCLMFDVGLMPLPDTPWTRGKCGYKLIQYMACGLPVIASPVGVNTDIVTPEENGFLARTPEEWLTALRWLFTHPEQAAALGAAGRRRVEHQYCLNVTAPQLAGILRECASGKTKTSIR